MNRLILPLLRSSRRFPLYSMLLASTALTGSVLTGSASAAPTPEQTELAERLLQAGQRLVGVPSAMPVAAAVADVAERLYENNVRLLRTNIDLELALGRRDRVLKLLGDLRRLDPGDQIAQVQSIDLQQSKLESAGDKADYLSRVAGSDKVPSEVRSHAAVLLSGIETERGRDDAAAAALAQALALNPLNPKALHLRADAVASTGTAAQRTAAWVDLLKADPLQFGTASRLGEELLRVGQVEQATDLYRKFFASVAAAGYGPGADESINFAHGLVVTSKLSEAGDVAAAALKDNPSDDRLHALRMLIALSAKDDAAFKSALGEARLQAIRDLMGLHSQLDPSAPRPDDSTEVKLPDVKVDAAAARANADPRMAETYLQALGNLAWIDAYYGRRAPDAPVTEAINNLAGADSPLAHRLAGFTALAADRLDEADVAFSPVAERDALSRLGLFALKLKKGEDKATIVAGGNKLLSELPTDVWPLVVRNSLKDAGPLGFRAAEADAVAAEAAKLPADTWTFAGQGRQLYLVDADPITGSAEIGQPILVRVTLQNIGNRPLAIGPGGAISQSISLDATVRGAAEQSFPGAAIAKMTGRLVLPPKQTTSTVVRLDSPELAVQLAQVPQAGAAVFVSAVTNPVSRENTIVPGPGGYRAQGHGVVDRPQVAFTRPEVREKLIKQLNSPDALARIRAVTALAACASWMRQTQDESLKPLFVQAADMLKQVSTKDASPTVRMSALQESVSLASDADRPAVIASMLSSADYESRVMGALISVRSPKAVREAALKPLTTDADETIRNLAVAVSNLPEAPAATQPAVK
ncbi:MAG: hypothetical protein JWM57_1124 [Phycisphaerales bacterium]|nr:hypothetical protein [Phycisphaerales bacterium]